MYFGNFNSFTLSESENRALILDHLERLRFYATFKVRKFESSFYKLNTFLQKTTTYIGLQAEQIFSVNI